MLFFFLIESEVIVFSVVIIKIAGTLGCDLRMPIMSVQIGYGKIMIYKGLYTTEIIFVKMLKPQITIILRV